MDKIIGRNLKILREAGRFTQDQVADFLKITRSAYSNYELGEREMPIEVLENAADLFGVELDVLHIAGLFARCVGGQRAKSCALKAAHCSSSRRTTALFA